MNIRTIITATLTLAATAAGVAHSADLTSQQRESWVIEGFSEENAERIISESPLGGAEGIWQASADGAKIAIISGNPPGAKGSIAGYLLVVIDSPRPALQPGTVMGWMRQSAKPRHFEGTLFTKSKGPRLTTPKTVTLRLEDSSHLTFTPEKGGLRFLPWRLLPYMFRSAVREQRSNKPDDLNGFVRLSPPADPPVRPRYL